MSREGNRMAGSPRKRVKKIGMAKGATLHPTQFKVNEAWLAFKINDVAIRTDRDGDFDCIALMDAASCFILASTLASSREAEPSKRAVRELLKEAKAHKNQLPETLFIPTGQFNSILPAEAERQGMAVVRVPEDQLLVFIGEVRESFKESFFGGSVE
jgi:hypothetical protein